MNRFPKFAPKDLNLEIDSQKLVDNHCHLYAFEDVESVISKAKELGVVKIVTVSTSYERAVKNYELKERYRDTVLLSVGYAPKSMMRKNISPEEARNEIKKFLDAYEKDVFSIGEIGLYEKYRGTKQRALFKEMLKLASEKKLGVNVHSARLEKEVLEDLKGFDYPVVLHAFQGVEQAKEACDRGYYISIAPESAIGYDAFKRELEIIRNPSIPIEKLLTESDGRMKDGKVVCQPSDVMGVAELISKERDMELKDVCEVLFNNFERYSKSKKS